MSVRAPINRGVENLLEIAVGWIDRPAFASDRGRIGRVSAVLVDGERRPQWVVVRSGRFRRSTEMLPFGDCALDGGCVWVDQGAGSDERVRVARKPRARARRRGDCV